MSNQAGWVSVWRQELDNPIITKSMKHFAVWHLLLLLATAKPRKELFRGQMILLQPGQLITTRKEIAAMIKDLTESDVQRVLSDFEKYGQITQEQSNKGRLISVVNWGRYQNNTAHQKTPKMQKTAHQKTPKMQKTAHQKTPEKLQNNAILYDDENNSEHQLNTNCTSTEHQLHTQYTIYNNNVNNDNKVNKVNKPSAVKKSDLPKTPTLDEIKAYCNQQNLTIDCERFYDYYSRYGWQMKGEPLDWREVAESWNRTEYRKPKKENKLSVSQSYDIDEWEDYSIF